MVGICTHAGFNIPDQESILGVLNLFPNLERVEYNVVDSRVKDHVYWASKVADFGTANEGLKFKRAYPEETYLSKIPLNSPIAGDIFEDIKSQYEDVFKELVKEAPQIVVFKENLERGDHAYLNPEVMQLLGERVQYRKEKQYDDADKTKAILADCGIEIISEDKDSTRMVVKNYSGIIEQKNGLMNILNNAYTTDSSLSEFQAAVQSRARDRAGEYLLLRGYRPQVGPKARGS